MNKFLSILFILFSLSVNSQQIVKVCDDQQTTFTYNTFTSENGSYFWFIDDVSQQNNSNNLYVDWNDFNYGIHIIKVYFTSFNGCNSDTIEYIVSTVECDNSVLYAPNGFTPDGDGVNDEWKPNGYNWKSIKYMIFDRWGELIFESDNTSDGWDGTYKGILCKEDVYVYKILWMDNKSTKHVIYGHISLIK